MKEYFHLFCSIVLLAISASAAADPRGGRFCSIRYCSGLCFDGASERTLGLLGNIGDCDSAVAEQCQIDRQDYTHKYTPVRVCGRFLKDSFYTECEGDREIPSRCATGQC